MDMQHREHSKHNEYTYGWIFIQEIYLITCLSMCLFEGRLAGLQELQNLHSSHKQCSSSIVSR